MSAHSFSTYLVSWAMNRMGHGTKVAKNGWTGWDSTNNLDIILDASVESF